MTERIRVAEVLTDADYLRDIQGWNDDQITDYLSRKLRVVAAYMPANYVARLDDDGSRVLIEGIDRAGWTLTEYVIPRLASGLIRAQEVAP